jgi:hypothetical protein
MIMPTSAVSPPCPVIKRGKRKKQPKLETVKRLARAILTKGGE